MAAGSYSLERLDIQSPVNGRKGTINGLLLHARSESELRMESQFSWGNCRYSRETTGLLSGRHMAVKPTVCRFFNRVPIKKSCDTGHDWFRSLDLEQVTGTLDHIFFYRW